MAVTAKFIADFNSFNAEVQKAEASLDSFEGTTNKTSEALVRMSGPSGFDAPRSGADRLRSSLQSMDGVLNAVGLNISAEQRALNDLASAAGKTAAELGAIATAGLVVGTAVAAWKFGRAIADYFELDKAISEGTAALLGWGDAAQQVAQAQRDVIEVAIKRGANVLISYTDALKFNDEWIKKNRESWKAYGEAIAEMTLKGDDWQKTLQTIDGETVEAVKFYLEAGVSQKNLAAAYALTAAQVQAVAKAREAELEVIKRADAEAVKGATAVWEAWKKEDELLAHMDKVTFELAMEHQKQWREEQFKQTQRINAALLAEFEAQTKLNAAAGLDASGAIQLQSTAADKLTEALARLHLEKVEGISQAKQEQVLIDQYTKALYDEAVAQDAAAAAVANHAQEIEHTTAAAKAQVFSLGPIGSRAEQAALAEVMDIVNASPVGMAMRHGTTNIATMNEFNEMITQLMAARGFAPSRDIGGSVEAGKPVLIGRGAQPELFIPSTSGTMIPNAGSGGTTTINLVVDGRVLASIVNDYNEKRMKQGRQFPAN